MNLHDVYMQGDGLHPQIGPLKPWEERLQVVIYRSPIPGSHRSVLMEPPVAHFCFRPASGCGSGGLSSRQLQQIPPSDRNPTNSLHRSQSVLSGFRPVLPETLFPHQSTVYSESHISGSPTLSAL